MLQAFLDEELRSAERGAVEAHLSACSMCTATLAELRADAELLAGALRVLDVSVPPQDLEALSRAAAAPLRIERGAAEEGRIWREVARMRWARRSLLRAAVLVLGFAAAASAAIPESPVRRWAVEAWKGAVALFDRSPGEQSQDGQVAEEATPSPTQPADPAVLTSGVSILPADGHLRVVLRSPDPSCQVRVVLVDGPRAGIRAEGGSETARFATGPGRIEVSGAGAGVLTVELPRTLPRAVVEVDGKPYVVKEGADLRILAPRADSMGAEVTFRVRP